MPCRGFLSGSRCDPVAETVAEPDSFPIRLVFPTLRLFIRCNVISTCCIMERRTKREPHRQGFGERFKALVKASFVHVGLSQYER